MKKQSNIPVIMFLFLWTGVAITMTVLFAAEAGILAIIPGFMSLIGIVLIVQTLRGKTIKGSNSDGANYLFGKSSIGRLLKVWDESTIKLINGVEEQLYVYFAEFEFVDENGVKCRKKQSVNLDIYNELLHTQNDAIPIIIHDGTASIDENKIGLRDRFEK